MPRVATSRLSRFRLMAGALALSLASLAPVGRAQSVELRTAAAARALSTDEAARHPPARLRGVVIGKVRPEAFVLQDATECIYVQGPPALVATIRAGDFLEIEGVCDPGGYSPMIIMSALARQGTVPIPAPRRVTFDQLNTGGLDSQWVEVVGVVRTCEPVAESDLGPPAVLAHMRDNPPEPAFEGITKLKLAFGAERVAVQVNAPMTAETYVDAEVRVRGFCFNRHNRNRQLLDCLLLVPEGNEPAVEKPPAADPFGSPPQTIASILQFSPHADFNHVVHVRGVVTHHSPGLALWIHDGERGLRVGSRQKQILKVGDEVDVVGFPAKGDYTPGLEDVVFRRRAERRPPPAVPVSTMSMAVKHDAELVKIEATLTNIRAVQDGWLLTLDWDPLPITASLPGGGPAAAVPAWRAGSFVGVTGICSVIGPDSGPLSGVLEAEIFQLLMRSPADLVLLRSPPWWTAQRIAWLLSGVAVALVLAVAGVALVARLRLREQARQRAMAETEFSAVFRERNRLAREIHDTLAQGLNATSVQLELAKNALGTAPEAAREHLDLAHRNVRSSLAEARSSIWNMRSHALETGDLASALGGVLRLLANGSGPQGSVRVVGPARRLAAATENNLLRIGQEAIVNAARHARANAIAVTLEFTERHVSLAVKDDGIGFDTARPPRGASGFGLVGMRERAAQLGGVLNVTSAPGRGSLVALTVSAPP